jgi:hypothetical protein
MALNEKIVNYLQVNRIRRGMVWGSLLLMALVAFEVFNYSTTEFAMSDLLGNLQFAGLRWSTILAIAFCGIDFAGIARLFTPEQNSGETNESWYLFAAWLLAATMNATLTWWGVSIAVASHETLGNAILPRHTLLNAVPVFVALVVWLIRILIIGTFSMSGERIFSQGERQPRRRKAPVYARKPSQAAMAGLQASAARSNRRPAGERASRDLTYEPVNMKPASSSRYTQPMS